MHETDRIIDDQTDRSEEERPDPQLTTWLGSSPAASQEECSRQTAAHMQHCLACCSLFCIVLRQLLYSACLALPGLLPFLSLCFPPVSSYPQSDLSHFSHLSRALLTPLPTCLTTLLTLYIRQFSLFLFPPSLSPITQVVSAPSLPLLPHTTILHEKGRHGQGTQLACLSFALFLPIIVVIL